MCVCAREREGRTYTSIEKLKEFKHRVQSHKKRRSTGGTNVVEGQLQGVERTN